MCMKQFFLYFGQSLQKGLCIMSQSAHNTSLTEHMNARYRDFIFFFNKKGPAADATDAPQP